MTEERLRRLLEQVAAGRLGAAAALERLRHLPFEDLGFAKVDQHRALRRGVPEVIFGEGKSAMQIAAIGARVVATGANLVVTRLEV
jgi:NCAIR mutase (PurE)-related protein